MLTFDYAREPVVWPTWCCAPRWWSARRASKGKPLEAHYAHLLVHGALHAQGYDHEDQEQARGDGGAEIRLLASLGFADPYLR